MAAPIFPGVEPILDIIMSELPPGVFAEDRANDPNTNKRSVSSAEVRSHSQIYADLYLNLNDIYKDKFLSTSSANGLGLWEKELFTEPQDQSLPIETRRANLMAQLRYVGGISLPIIQALVDQILSPFSLTSKVVPWNGCLGAEGAWILGESTLDLDTFLAGRDPLWGARRDMTPLDCNLNYSAAGITAQDLADIQETAYTYELDIYGHADNATLARLDKRLTQKEPARSTHVIRNDNPQPGWIDPTALDGMAFDGDYLWDVSDFGVYGDPPGSYDDYDFGGF